MLRQLNVAFFAGTHPALASEDPPVRRLEPCAASASVDEKEEECKQVMGMASSWAPSSDGRGVLLSPTPHHPSRAR